MFVFEYFIWEMKRMIWFTSDLHLGHRAAISMCERPFETIEEMNEILICNFNSCVKKNDTVYILAQGLPELIEIATEKAHKDNYKEKHNRDAKYGWYKYTSRFAFPVYDGDGEIDRYNVFQVIMIVRHAEDEKIDVPIE